jgi:ADP-ribose pyrophosphatase YjhB (NUDIX family)
MSHTKIGCEIFIIKDGQVLLGKRGPAAWQTGKWALPGGHLELHERLVDTVCREVKEEIGADITPNEVTLISIVDDIRQDLDTHYIHVTFELTNPTFEPRIMEPESCTEWRYFPLDNLPEDFMDAHRGIVANYRAKQLYAYETN